jgi:hypothetical protein
MTELSTQFEAIKSSLHAVSEYVREGGPLKFLIEWHAERYFKRPPTELVRQRARTAGYQCTSKVA